MAQLLAAINGLVTLQTVATLAPPTPPPVPTPSPTAPPFRAFNPDVERWPEYIAQLEAHFAAYYIPVSSNIESGVTSIDHRTDTAQKAVPWGAGEMPGRSRASRSCEAPQPRLCPGVESPEASRAVPLQGGSCRTSSKFQSVQRRRAAYSL
ncbi:uncharacterized protein LOC126202972 [Schistocerca nitens]|uniref:uncharacterized protein LOC126202972 n=1 Tax=Schistocerca nitens TaxID=7011 RepID=UPI00211875C4|nr:uncharacterized protein LOC126202972 [Schistocerca nitens]